MSADHGEAVPMVWHDEMERLAVWGTLDPPDACMCLECVLAPPAPPIEEGQA